MKEKGGAIKKKKGKRGDLKGGATFRFTCEIISSGGGQRRNWPKGIDGGGMGVPVLGRGTAGV